MVDTLCLKCGQCSLQDDSPRIKEIEKLALAMLGRKKQDFKEFKGFFSKYSYSLKGDKLSFAGLGEWKMLIVKLIFVLM